MAKLSPGAAALCFQAYGRRPAQDREPEREVNQHGTRKPGVAAPARPALEEPLVQQDHRGYHYRALLAEQHPLLVRRVGPVVGDQQLGQVRQTDQRVVLDERDVVEVEIVAQRVGIDEKGEPENPRRIRNELSRHDSIERKTSVPVYDSVRFVGCLSGFIGATQSPLRSRLLCLLRLSSCAVARGSRRPDAIAPGRIARPLGIGETE